MRLAAIACLALAASAGAQAPPVATAAAERSIATCPYVRCALGIAPVWNGLAVVRGADRERVTSLDFFLPRPIDSVFAGDSARASAQRAFAVRRQASLLTDLGALLLAGGAATAVHDGRFTGTSRALSAVGAVAFVASVPLQFAADGWLSRAIWWHNSALGR